MNLQRGFAFTGMLVVGLYLIWVIFIWAAARHGEPSGAVLHHFDIVVTEGSKLQVRHGEIERLADESLPYTGYLQIREGYVSVVDRILGIAVALVAFFACCLLTKRGIE